VDVVGELQLLVFISVWRLEGRPSAGPPAYRLRA